MTSLFALTYPYLSSYQHIGASISSGVDIGGYASSFAGQARGTSALGGWNQFGSLVNQAAGAGAGAGAQNTYDKAALTLNGHSNLSPASIGASSNQVASNLARDGLMPFKTRKYTAKGTRSCPYNMNTLLNDDVSAIVRRRNERERERVRCVNTHYEHLKHHLPMENFNREKRVSKLEILRTAIKYISELQDVLEQCNNNNTRADETHKPTKSRAKSCFDSSEAAARTEAKDVPDAGPQVDSDMNVKLETMR